MTCFLNKSRGKFVINIGIMKILFQFLLCQGNNCCNCRLIEYTTMQLIMLYLISIRILNNLHCCIRRVISYILSIYYIWTIYLLGYSIFNAPSNTGQSVISIVYSSVEDVDVLAGEDLVELSFSCSFPITLTPVIMWVDNIAPLVFKSSNKYAI